MFGSGYENCPEFWPDWHRAEKTRPERLVSVNIMEIILPVLKPDF
jgi:hypothetical protein